MSRITGLLWSVSSSDNKEQGYKGKIKCAKAEMIEGDIKISWSNFRIYLTRICITSGWKML